MTTGALFVVVSGPPASGKSTLAPPLARELGLPLVAKDTIKDALMSVLPVPDVEASRHLGRAAVEAMLAVAGRSPVGAVIESNFYRSRAAERLGRLPGAVVEVFCRCDEAVARERYRARTGTRQGGHFDAVRSAGELWNDELTEPVAGGWPVLEVDTNRPVDMAAVVAFVRSSRDPVRLVPYDERWPDHFAATERDLRVVLAPWVVDIEHIGSTAVPGLPAKPVIDILVGVRTLDDTAEIVAAIESLGYEYVPEFEDELPDRRYFRRWAGGRRSHHIHLVERANAGWWDRHVRFRDWLRTHPDDRDRYAALKRELAAAHGADRAAYTDAKAQFVRTIEEVSAAFPTGGSPGAARHRRRQSPGERLT